MADEHTPLPWHASRKSRYVSDINHRVIAEISPLHAFEANAAFIVNCVNSHDALVKALRAIIAANNDFRKGMPEKWEGDPLQDAIDAAGRLVQENAAAMVPKTREFYGAECPSYPDCKGGCGLGCTKEIERARSPVGDKE